MGPSGARMPGMACARYALAAVLLVPLLLFSSCGGAEPRSGIAQPIAPQVTDCNVGGKPRARGGYRDSRRMVLGCGRISPQGRFELVGSRDRREGLCLSVQFRTEEGEGSSLCQGSGPPPGPPKDRDLSLVGGTGDQSGYVMTGFATERLATVRFDFSHRGQRRSVAASVVGVRGQTLTRFGAPEAFGYVVAGLPSGAQGIDAVALDAGGRTIDQVKVGSLLPADGSTIFKTAP